MTVTPNDKNYLKPVLWLFIGLQLLLFAPRLNSDGAYYYEYLRSWVVQNDLNFDDEREFFTWEWVPVFRDFLPGDWDDTGYPPNIFSFGPALFWLPFYLLAHLLITILNGFRFGLSTTGYGMAYRFLPMCASMLSGLITIHLCDRLGQKAGFRETVRANALFFYLGASHLPAFLFVTPAFSHASSVMFTCWFVMIWYLAGQEGGKSWNLFQFALYGFVGGLAVIARWQNLFCVILPAIDGLIELIRCRSKGSFGKICLRWSVFWTGLICAVFPQLLVTHTLYGSWVTDPQGDGGMHWFSPSFKIVLFDGIKGLFTVNPILFPAILALPFLWRWNRRLTWGMLLLVSSQSYINAVRRDWAGVGFGMRRFLNLTPAFVLGLMVIFALVQAKKHTPWRRLIQVVGSLLIVWNLLLMAQYYLSPLGAPWIQMTFSQMVSAQFSSSPALLNELIGSSLLGAALAGNGFLGLFTLMGLFLTIVIFWKLPKLSQNTQSIFVTRPDKMLSGILIFWVVIIGWLTHSILQAKPYNVVNLLPGLNRFGTIRTLKLNPESGYFGYASGVEFGPDQSVRVLDPKPEYDLNKFLAPGELRLAPTLPIEQAGSVAWEFHEMVNARRIWLIASNVSGMSPAERHSVAEIFCTTAHGAELKFGVSTQGESINNHWPAQASHISAGDTRYQFDLGERRMIRSLGIRYLGESDVWTVKGVAFE